MMQEPAQDLVAVDLRLKTVEDQLQDIKLTLAKQDTILGRQDAERASLRADVKDVVDILKEFRFAVSFIMKLAVFIKWFAALVIAVAAIWGTLNGIHQGKLPSLGED